MKFLTFLFLCTGLLLSSLVTASEVNDGVAKVIILKGDVKANYKGKERPLKKGDNVQEGAVITTASKSFAKLLFIDKSQITIGPEGKMEVNKFPKNQAGILTLVKGQLRSQVSKDYMDNTKKNQSKLFVKTQTAAMGVRGTDFQVSYNEQNKSTALVTFEGQVAMAQIQGTSSQSFNTQNLEKIVSSTSAVLVQQGQFSGANPQMVRASLPVKISPAQLKALESNTTLGATPSTQTPSASTSDPSVGSNKNFRSTALPGLTAPETDKTMAQGFFDEKTGAVAPKAGGMIDLKTALYVQPPKDANFNSETGTFDMPANVGRVDEATGSFKNDQFELTPEGTFVATETASSTGTNSDTSSEANNPVKASSGPTASTRAPANAEGSSASSTSDGAAPVNAPSVLLNPATLDLPAKPADFKIEGQVPGNSSIPNSSRTPASTSGANGEKGSEAKNTTSPATDIFTAPPKNILGADQSNLMPSNMISGTSVTGNTSANSAQAANNGVAINPRDFDSTRILQDNFKTINNTQQENQIIQQRSQADRVNTQIIINSK